MEPAAALALVARAPVVHLATTTPEGAPLLRAVHAVVVDGALAFHGARSGEKAACLGREAVASAEEVHAIVPSWFVHPENAAVASTIFESAQLHGRLEAVEAPGAKAGILEALMRKYQPEGRYRALDPRDPLYAGGLAATLVVRLVPERISGKAKLGQNRSPAALSLLLERLAERDLPGDRRAIERIRAAVPGLPAPSPRAPAQAGSLADVRAAIDRIDRKIVPLIAERARWVEAAARLKRSDDEARAPARVDEVVAGVTRLADEHGAPRQVVEAAYREMIAAFIELERARLAAGGGDGER